MSERTNAEIAAGLRATASVWRRHDVTPYFLAAELELAAARLDQSASSEIDALWVSLPCDDQHVLATRIAANVGYQLVAEPPHPDAPTETVSNFSAEAIYERQVEAERDAALARAERAEKALTHIEAIAEGRDTLDGFPRGSDENQRRLAEIYEAAFEIRAALASKEGEDGR